MLMTQQYCVIIGRGYKCIQRPPTTFRLLKYSIIHNKDDKNKSHNDDKTVMSNQAAVPSLQVNWNLQ